MTRLATMLATVLSSSTLGTSAFVDLPKTVIWNASASAPIGLYSLQAADEYRRYRPGRDCAAAADRASSWPLVVICRSACR